MYDIPELEKKWRKYKRNQIKRPLIIGLTTSIILIGVGALSYTYIIPKFFSGNKDNNVASNTTNTQVAVNTNSVNSKQNSATTNSEPAIIIKRESQQNQNNTNALIATKASSQMGENSQGDTIDLSKATIVKPNVPDDEIRVIGFDNKEKKDIKDKYTDILIPKKSTQEIEERERISELEERFATSQDPQDSLEIAKYYYKIGQYKKAEDWAVNTNNIDGDLEDSWLIFAKAKAKQGFRVDAIKVLQSFYDETNSQKAKILLDKIRRGKSF